MGVLSGSVESLKGLKTRKHVQCWNKIKTNEGLLQPLLAKKVRLSFLTSSSCEAALDVSFDFGVKFCFIQSFLQLSLGLDEKGYFTFRDMNYVLVSREGICCNVSNKIYAPFRYIYTLLLEFFFSFMFVEFSTYVMFDLESFLLS